MPKNLRRMYVASLLLAAGALCAIGCVRRELTVTSDPPGALVYLNGEEVGRTPVTRPFTFYGTYDVTLRKEGYETLKTKKLVLAPWWQWVPFDLAAELFPLTDRQKIGFTMKSVTTQPADPEQMFAKADELKRQLPETRPAATRKSSTKPAATTPAR